MFYSGDDFYPDDITSGPIRRNDIPELEDEDTEEEQEDD